MSRTAGGHAERDAWIALASVPGVGDHTFERLLAAYGSAREALESITRLRPRRADRDIAGLTGLRLRPGLGAAIRVAAADPVRPQRRMVALGGWLLTPLDANYPSHLHELEHPPAVVFGLGDPASLVATGLIAVVGTRRPTGMGRDLARRIGARLAEVGATVVSGLAVGVDGAAHQAALETGGQTIAVVGGGLDEPGPAGHRRLARSIARQGAVIAELAPGIRPTRGTFPRRNRIISGLSGSTIVVEAPARSGALITARHALEQGRGLLVVPGRPMDPRVAGNLALLRESRARPLVGLDEMVVDLGLDRPGEGSTTCTPQALPLAAALAMLSPPARAVAEALHDRAQTADSICRTTDLPPGVVAAALTLLQLRGWARVLGVMQLPAGPLLETGPRHGA